MRNHKQITVKNSVIETLDRIREQLPKRGSLMASYGDAIQWLDEMFVLHSTKINEQDIEIRRLLSQKKVRK